VLVNHLEDARRRVEPRLSLLLGASRSVRREGPHQFSQRRPLAPVSILQSLAAADRQHATFARFSEHRDFGVFQHNRPEYGFTASAEDKGDARLVRITDIAPDGRIRKDEPKFINLTQESEPYLLKKGDLLVARTGATFGKTMLFDEKYPAVFASYLIRLRFPQDIILPEFYWSFAQSEKRNCSRGNPLRTRPR